jgi:tRNA nucleotidyltransferase/poly(A) polymerase
VSDDLRAALDPVADAFEQLGVAYRIGGSVASSALGVARSSLDVDVVADLTIEQVDALVARLEDAFYVDRAMIEEAVRRRDCFNVIHLATRLTSSSSNVARSTKRLSGA